MSSYDFVEYLNGTKTLEICLKQKVDYQAPNGYDRLYEYTGHYVDITYQTKDLTDIVTSVSQQNDFGDDVEFKSKAELIDYIQENFEENRHNDRASLLELLEEMQYTCFPLEKVA